MNYYPQSTDTYPAQTPNELLPTATVRVLKVYLFQQPPETEFFHRDLAVNVNHSTLNTITDMIQQNERVQDLTDGLVTVTEAKNRIILPYQGESRFSGYIVARVNSPYGGESDEVLHFYTDYADATREGHLSPDMRLYFSSAQVTRHHRVNVGGQAQYKSVLTKNYDIITNDDNMHNAQGLDLQGMRPSDVMNHIPIQSQLKDSGYGEVNSIFVPSQRPNNTGLLSNRCNNNLNYYGQNSVTAYLAANMAMEANGANGFNPYALGSDDSTTVYSDASRSLMEESPSHLELVKHFTDRFGYITDLNFITMGDLQTLCPDLPGSDTYVLALLDPRAMQFADQGLDVWNNNLLETTIAYELSHALPALLSGQAIVNWAGIVSSMPLSNMANMSTHGDIRTSRINTVVSQAPTQMDVVTYERLILDTVYSVMSKHYVQDWSVNINCSLIRSCELEIQLDMNPLVRLTVPNYCSNLTSPCVTYGDDAMSGFATNMNVAIQNCAGATSAPVSSEPVYY